MTKEELENELESMRADVANLHLQLSELSWKEQDAYTAFSNERNINETLVTENKALKATISKMEIDKNIKSQEIQLILKEEEIDLYQRFIRGDFDKWLGHRANPKDISSSNIFWISYLITNGINDGRIKIESN